MHLVFTIMKKNYIILICYQKNLCRGNEYEKKRKKFFYKNNGCGMFDTYFGWAYYIFTLLYLVNYENMRCNL